MNKFFGSKIFLKVSFGKQRIIPREIAEHMENYSLSESSLSALSNANETKSVCADSS